MAQIKDKRKAMQRQVMNRAENYANAFNRKQAEPNRETTYSVNRDFNRNRSSDSGGSGGSGGIDNAALAEQFNVTQPGEAYRDTGGTAQDFQKDLAKAAQFGLFTQHPFTKELMRKYNLDTQDVINLRLGTGSGGVGRADPSKLYNKYATKPSQLGVFQKVLGSGMIPMALGPGNLGPGGISAFREGMSVYDRPPAQGFKDQLGALLGSRFDMIAGGSPYGIAALDYGRNVLGYEGDQLNQFASSVAGNRDLYNQMMIQPYSIDKQFQNMMYGYQQANQPKGRDDEPKVTEPTPVAGYQPVLNPYLPNQGGIGLFS